MSSGAAFFGFIADGIRPASGHEIEVQVRAAAQSSSRRSRHPKCKLGAKQPLLSRLRGLNESKCRLASEIGAGKAGAPIFFHMLDHQLSAAEMVNSRRAFA